uniref:Putative replicase n=1 Tax=Hatsystermes virus TaxID=2796593 RepID=A0A7T7K8R3_9VIRU|nr:putative replicase [Hatsystermes virus]
MSKIYNLEVFKTEEMNEITEGNVVRRVENPRIPYQGKLSDGARKHLLSVVNWAEKNSLVADAHAKDRLIRWLSREARGEQRDLRTPIFRVGEGSWESRESITKRFWSLLQQIHWGKGQVARLILTREQDRLHNIGSWSEFLAWSDDGPAKVFDIYKDKSVPNINRRAWSRALLRAMALLPRESVSMSSISEVLNSVGIENFTGLEMSLRTNSGPPYYKSPWKPREGQDQESSADSRLAFDYIKARSELLFRQFMRGDPQPLYAVAAKRLVQKDSIDARKRIVIALEKSEPVISKCYTPRVYEGLLRHHSPDGIHEFVALSDLPNIDLTMQLLLQVAEKGGRVILSGDYSGYDHSLSPWHIKQAGLVLASWVKGGRNLVNAQVASMVDHVTLITPDRVWGAKPSSMKSGSGLTNILDSLCNLLVLFYGHEVGAYSLINCCVQGDDFLLDAEGVTPQVMSQVADEFGLVAHPDKQSFNQGQVDFLQRQHFYGLIGGVASVARTLGVTLSYETMSHKPSEWNGWADVVRIIAQLENAVFNPGFETLVKFVSSGDAKYHLGAGKTPEQIYHSAASGAIEDLTASYGSFGKSRGRYKSTEDSFKGSAVIGVLNGEVMPPVGSYARFSRAYGDLRLASVVLNGLERANRPDLYVK